MILWDILAVLAVVVAVPIGWAIIRHCYGRFRKGIRR